MHHLLCVNFDLSSKFMCSSMLKELLCGHFQKLRSTLAFGFSLEVNYIITVSCCSQSRVRANSNIELP